MVIAAAPIPSDDVVYVRRWDAAAPAPGLHR